MIWGMCKNVPTPGGAEGADLGGSEGADFSFEFLYGFKWWFQCKALNFLWVTGDPFHNLWSPLFPDSLFHDFKEKKSKKKKKKKYPKKKKKFYFFFFSFFVKTQNYIIPDFKGPYCFHGTIIALCTSKRESIRNWRTFCGLRLITITEFFTYWYTYIICILVI